MKLNIQQFGGRGASSGSTGSSWSILVKQFPGKLITDGINQIQLFGDRYGDQSEIQKVYDLQSGYQPGVQWKDANNTTLKELNEAPIVFTNYTDNGIYMNIYKNRNEMMKSIQREYGGFKEFTGSSSGSGSRYSISSLVGGGDFFLERYKYAKGGWRWMDGNGNWVEGFEKQWKTRRERK